MEFFESQKLNFSNFPELKGLNKIKKTNKNHSKPPNIAPQ